MAFNTLEFALFFCIVLAVSWLLAGWSRLRTYFILGASIYFYASNNSWQTILLIATTTIDYAVCLGMARTKNERKRKILLFVSLGSNLGMLGFFKYNNFFGENVGRLLRGLGWPVDWVDVNILLPVGISFFTFEALSYTIDVYRRKIDAERDYARLAFLVSFFPHLIAGPIVRASAFFPQIGRRPTITSRLVLGGSWLFQEDLAGRWAGALCGCSVFISRADRDRDDVDRCLCVRVPNLFRFFGLHGYRDWDGKAAWV
jgi:alginate O-acetyltransferase complex protein AlgI